MESVTAILAKHGARPRVSGNTPPLVIPAPSCDVCRDIGFVREDRELDDPLFGRALLCECRREAFEREKREHLLRYCNLPPNAARLTLATFRVTPVLHAAYAAALDMASPEPSRVFLTLLGPPGCGKTHLGVAICHAWLDRGQAAKFVRETELYDDLRAGFRKGEERDYSERLVVYETADLLVIDDLGVARMTDFTREQLDDLIDHRYRYEKPMVVTSNLSLDEIAEKCSDRIASRLGDRRIGTVVGIKASDYRLKEERGR